MKDKDILQFQGENRFLSNFTPCKIYIEGIEYKSVEHAYMSQKSDDSSWKKLCQETLSPGAIKKQSRRIKLKNDWDKIKDFVMEECIDQKFNQEPFKTLLLKTGECYIQEGNYWNDKYWGVCLKTDVGLNKLGNIIMAKREKLKQENKNEYQRN